MIELPGLKGNLPWFVLTWTGIFGVWLDTFVLSQITTPPTPVVQLGWAGVAVTFLGVVVPLASLWRQREKEAWDRENLRGENVQLKDAVTRLSTRVEELMDMIAIGRENNKLLLEVKQAWQIPDADERDIALKQAWMRKNKP